MRDYKLTASELTSAVFISVSRQCYCHPVCLDLTETGTEEIRLFSLLRFLTTLLEKTCAAGQLRRRECVISIQLFTTTIKLSYC